MDQNYPSQTSSLPKFTPHATPQITSTIPYCPKIAKAVPPNIPLPAVKSVTDKWLSNSHQIKAKSLRLPSSHILIWFRIFCLRPVVSLLSGYPLERLLGELESDMCGQRNMKATIFYFSFILWVRSVRCGWHYEDHFSSSSWYLGFRVTRVTTHWIFVHRKLFGWHNDHTIGYDRLLADSP